MSALWYTLWTSYENPCYTIAHILVNCLIKLRLWPQTLQRGLTIVHKTSKAIVKSTIFKNNSATVSPQFRHLPLFNRHIFCKHFEIFFFSRKNCVFNTISIKYDIKFNIASELFSFTLIGTSGRSFVSSRPMFQKK